MLNEIQPLSEMMKRDDIHFTPELVFSNTIRSLINSQRMDGETRKESKLDENRKSDRLKIEDKKPEEYVYLVSNYFSFDKIIELFQRANPIESARMALRTGTRRQNRIQATATTTTSTSCEAA